MDRREALTKLAVSGAIVAGSSTVLSSRAVADTGSCQSTNLVLTQAKFNINTGNNRFYVRAQFSGSLVAGSLNTAWTVNSFAVNVGSDTYVLRRQGPTSDMIVGPATSGSASGTTLFEFGRRTGSAGYSRLGATASYNLTIVAAWTSTDPTCGGPASATYGLSCVNGVLQTPTVTG